MQALDFSVFKLALYDWHKSLGTLVLFLFALRLFWRWVSRPPISLPEHKKWERVLAHIAHYTLYLLLFLLPLSGWLMSSAGDFSHSFFGLFTMPDLVEKDETLFRQMREVHEFLVYLLLFVLFFHIAGALKHHILDRDITLVRMLLSPREGYAERGKMKEFLAGFVLMAALLFYGAVAILLVQNYMKVPENVAVTDIQDQADRTGPQATTFAKNAVHNVDRWAIDHENSRLSFYVDVYGEPFEAVFPAFDGDIIFDPGNLAKSRVDIVIPLAMVSSGSAERDGFMVMEDWFYAESFPESRFYAESFKKTGQNQYIAEGELTIRGVTRPVSLPFTLQIKEEESGEKTADMKADLVINRLDYGVGQGAWQKTDVVGNAVKITVSLKARREDQ